MEAIQLIDRFIDDISKSAEAKQSTRPYKEICQRIKEHALSGKVDSTYDIRECWNAMCLDSTIPHILGYLSQFINLNQRRIKYNFGDEINILEYLTEVKNSKDHITNHFETIRTNTEFVFVSGDQMEPAYNVIIQQADWLHEEAEAVHRNHLLRIQPNS